MLSNRKRSLGGICTQEYKCTVHQLSYEDPSEMNENSLMSLMEGFLYASIFRFSENKGHNNILETNHLQLSVP